MIDENYITDQKLALERYIKRKDIYDAIVSLIIENAGAHYTYHGNEIPFIINPSISRTLGKERITPDLVFFRKDNNSILLVEETNDPTKKGEQLAGYFNIDRDGVKAILNTESRPTMDIFLVVPKDKRSEAVSVFDETKKQHGQNIGKGVGVSIWYYDKDAFVRCSGNAQCNILKSLPTEISVRTENKIGIYKIAPDVERLRFMLVKLIEKEELGTKDAKITHEKLKAWFKDFGITDEERFKNVLTVGGSLGILKNVSADSLYAEPAYFKMHQSSLARIMAFLIDPIAYMEQYLDDKEKREQKEISDFISS